MLPPVWLRRAVLAPAVLALSVLAIVGLPVQFQCVAASIERAAEHWFVEGPVVDAVLASCAVPGVLPPVRIGDETYLDGGLVNSIPVERALRLGAQRSLTTRLTRARSGYEVELAVLGHRILEFLPQETLLHENVDTRREVAGTHLARIEIDGARVLLAAEDQLRFLLAFRLRSPHRHRDRHEHHQDGNAHEQRRHRVPAFATNLHRYQSEYEEPSSPVPVAPLLML